MIVLNEGVLKSAYDKTEKGILRYDCRKHASTYVGTYGEMNAEPEFTGKYIDICTKYYQETNDKKYLKCAETVVNSIIDNQGEDGYLGMLEDAFRWKNFSVWNQTFTVLGLLSYYREVKDKKVLEAAEKCGVYIANYFLGHPEVDILDAENYGTQNISFLCVLPELYLNTNNKVFYDFMLYIVNRIKNSDLNFFEFDDILSLRSKKAIENFVVLIGILRYGELTGDIAAFTGAEKYWQQVADTQIRNTGNGSIHELWCENGNAPVLLSEEDRPNENCVAVGWIELSLLLFHKSQESKYLDAIEKTLFNHLLGSISDDGSDFAYYQPNFGNKIFSTSEDKYKCCRYRGFTVFSYLKDMLYYADDKQIIPMIYQASVYEDETIKICQQTNYPYDLNIKFEVTYKQASKRVVKLRIPYWCEDYHVITDGGISVSCKKDGFIEAMGNGTVELILECGVNMENGIIEGKKYAAFTRGPILLAAVENENIEDISVYAQAPMQMLVADGFHLKYEMQGDKAGKNTTVIFKDYASAGRHNGEKFTVWIPVK